MRAPAQLFISVFLAFLALVPASADQSGGYDSFIELPVRVPLGPLYREIERRVPLEVGDGQSRVQGAGADVRYGARRSPLQLSMHGDTLFARAMVGYWVRARKKVLGKIPVEGSCGVNEAPRGVILSLASRIGIRSDWRLRTNTYVYPPQFMSPCQMTLANIDVTGLIARALYRELWETARTQIDSAVPKLADLRGPAETAWRYLQTPVEIDQGVWLVLEPRGISVTQPHADGQEMELSVQLAATARLLPGQPAELEAVALPPLVVRARRQQGVRLPARIALSYVDAGRLLQSRVQGQVFEWAGREARIDRLRLAPDEGGLGLTVWVTGDVEGTVHLSGVPIYDDRTAEVYFDPLDYRLETDDAGISAMEDAMHELFRAMLVNKARWPVADRIEDARLRLERALNQVVPASFAVHARLKALRPTAIHATADAILVEGVVNGTVRLSPH